MSLLGSKSDAQMWEILESVQQLSGFDWTWSEQIHRAYAVESHLSCGAHDVAGTNLDGRSNDCTLDSRIGICSLECLEEKSDNGRQRA